MSDVPYFACVTSAAAFKARFDAEQGKSFRDLQTPAASDWGREHLLACRAIHRPIPKQGPNTKPGILLPIFSEYQQSLENASFPQQEVRNFLEGPEQDYATASEHLLVRNYGVSLGQVWAAMALLGEPGDDSRRERPKRDRRRTNQENYADSSTMRVGSSSPVEEDNSQGSLNYVDPGSQTRLTPPEDQTVRFAACVIRHVLYFAPPQHSDSLNVVVEFRDAKTPLVARTLRGGISATDDGGLCLRKESDEGGFEVSKARVAILEAKKRFQCIEAGEPVISDACFAQMTCEALVARLTDREHHPDEE